MIAKPLVILTVFVLILININQYTYASNATITKVTCIRNHIIWWNQHIENAPEYYIDVYVRHSSIVDEKKNDKDQAYTDIKVFNKAGTMCDVIELYEIWNVSVINMSWNYDLWFNELFEINDGINTILYVVTKSGKIHELLRIGAMNRNSLYFTDIDNDNTIDIVINTKDLGRAEIVSNRINIISNAVLHYKYVIINIQQYKPIVSYVNILR